MRHLQDSDGLSKTAPAPNVKDEALVCLWHRALALTRRQNALKLLLDRHQLPGIEQLPRLLRVRVFPASCTVIYRSLTEQSTRSQSRDAQLHSFHTVKRHSTVVRTDYSTLFEDV